MLANWPPVDPTQIVQALPRLQETIDELYESGVFPPVDLYVGGQDVTVEVAAAGADPDNLRVAVTTNTVTITGDVRREIDLGDPYYQGIRRGEFHQSLNLPVPVDPSTAQADYRDGVLKLRMVKAEATKPHLVKVQHDAGAEQLPQELPESNLRKERVEVGSSS